MIQRIQTIYILLTLICMTIALFIPFCYYNYNHNEIALSAFGLSGSDDNISGRFPYYIGVFCSIGLSIMAIRYFKNRKKQLVIGKINYFVILITLVLILLDINYIANELSISTENIDYWVGSFLPIAALAFVFLANRGIKKDEKLVNSSLGRLR